MKTDFFKNLIIMKSNIKFLLNYIRMKALFFYSNIDFMQNFLQVRPPLDLLFQYPLKIIFYYIHENIQRSLMENILKPVVTHIIIIAFLLHFLKVLNFIVLHCRPFR